MRTRGSTSSLTLWLNRPSAACSCCLSRSMACSRARFDILGAMSAVLTDHGPLARGQSGQDHSGHNVQAANDGARRLLRQVLLEQPNGRHGEHHKATETQQNGKEGLDETGHCMVQALSGLGT